jgi:chromosome segregation ATPase
MNLDSVKRVWGALPLWGWLVAIGVVVLIVGGVVERGLESFRRSRFDSRMAESEQKISVMQSRIDELKQRAERAEAKAELIEQKAESLEELNRRQGARVADEVERLNQVFKAYEEDRLITGKDVSVEVRRERMCVKRRELGYPCR